MAIRMGRCVSMFMTGMWGDRSIYDLGGINLDFFNEGIRYAPLHATCGLKAIMIRVTGSAADIDYLAVRFGNGDVQQVPVREYFTPGSGSIWKPLVLNRNVGGVSLVTRSSFDRFCTNCGSGVSPNKFRIDPLCV